jgi:hypothetical protein
MACLITNDEITGYLSRASGSAVFAKEFAKESLHKYTENEKIKP